MPDNLTNRTLPNFVHYRSNRHRVSQGQYVNPDEVKIKVIEDINFLRGRISHIKHSKFVTPNSSILKTYESMLQSRESVLSWLLENDYEECDKRSHSG
ncbi:hypothetical protein [Agarilytica rhodophyticola]|uniref:hypothetical protein n=1 Tax=Agarilytica rhodophyticola TaxID=1737490 RepID=UPI000B348326|nr:hypothetical protein [Agarilytica rhodophyticola]